MLGVAILLVLLKLIETFVHVPFSSPAEQAFFGWKSVLFFIALLLLGSGFAHVLGFPGMWEKKVTNRQRIWFPLLIGVALGAVLLAVSRAVASAHAQLALQAQAAHAMPFFYLLLVQTYKGVGSAIFFTLFPVTFAVWFIGTLLLARRWPTFVFWTITALVCLLEPYWTARSNHWALLHAGPVSAAVVALLALMYALDFVSAILLRRFGFTAVLVLRLSSVAVWHIIGKF
jgi:hypothetical protein